MHEIHRRSLLSGIPAVAGAVLAGGPALPAPGHPEAPFVDPVLDAVARHAVIYAAVGEAPDDEDSAAFAEWEARVDAAWKSGSAWCA